MRIVSVLSGEPEVVDQLIIALGLGSSGHHISPTGPPALVRPIFIIDSIGNDNTTNSSSRRFTRDHSNCEAQQVCHHVTTQRGRFLVVITISWYIKLS